MKRKETPSLMMSVERIKSQSVETNLTPTLRMKAKPLQRLACSITNVIKMKLAIDSKEKRGEIKLTQP